MKKVTDTVRKATLMKAMHRFNVILRKITIALFIYRSRVNNSKMQTEIQKKLLQIAKEILSEYNAKVIKILNLKF